MEAIKEKIIQIYNGELELSNRQFEELFHEFLDWLDRGLVRAAEPTEQGWKVNSWVKMGILLGFRKSYLKVMAGQESFCFLDKHLFPLKTMRVSDGVRIVPGGSSVRAGSYLAPGTVVMPPAYVNIGAYVGKNSMIDSHALVGSCAQIGENVHISAASQIGGVLEPVGARPVIIEDNVFIGGNCGIYEGTHVRRGAVVAAGTILTRSVPVYDLVQQNILRGDKNTPLTIPENAVVVPGSRAVTVSPWASAQKLQIQCALIVKYRDEKTDQATVLEKSLHQT